MQLQIERKVIRYATANRENGHIRYATANREKGHIRDATANRENSHINCIGDEMLHKRCNCK